MHSRLQGTPEVACQQLGYETGEFRMVDDFNVTTISPPWLSALQCNGSEAAVSGCNRSDFGDTWTCGIAQQLSCFSRGKLRHRAAVWGNVAYNMGIYTSHDVRPSFRIGASRH